jgi:hypothetical protein
MDRKPKPAIRPDDPEQSRRFIEVAKEAGATEESDLFDDLVKRVAKSAVQKPKAAKGKTAQRSVTESQPKRTKDRT